MTQSERFSNFAGAIARLLLLLALPAALLGPRAAAATPITLLPGDILISDTGDYENGFVSRLLKVDPTGSSVTVIASSANSILKSPVSAQQDGDAALLVADQSATADQGAILHLDLGTGAIVPIMSGPGVAGVTGMTFGPGSDLFLALPYAFGGGFPGALYRNSRAGFPRTVLATGSQGARWAWRIAMEPSGSLLYINHADNSIRRIAASGGQMSAIYTDALLFGLEDFKLRGDGTIFALTNNGNIGHVVRIAPDGTISLLSEGGLLGQVLALAALPGGDVLVTDSRSGAVVRVNGTTGAQSYFLPPGSVFNPFGIDVVQVSATPAQPATWGAIKDRYRH